MFTFTVFGPPATKGSTRSFRSASTGAVVTMADCSKLPAWSQAVGWAARAARLPLVPRPAGVAVTLEVFSVRPKSAKQRVPSVKPDVDKVLRALLDALTGVAYQDDAQVVAATVKKAYGSEAKAVVTVSEVADAESR